MSENSNLNYVADLIIESFKDNELDAPYIEDKTHQLLQHDCKEQSLTWACNYLDRKNLATFAEKLGVTVDMLRVAGKVLAKIQGRKTKSCECKKDIEQKCLDRLKEEFPEGEDHKASLDGGYAITFPDFKQIGCFNVKNSVLVTLKNGNKRIKKPELSICFTYCPFCGVEYKEEQPHAE